MAIDANAEVLAAWLTIVELAVDRSVETLVSRETSVETTLETEVTDDSTAEIEVPCEVTAEVMAEAETAPDTVATALSSDEFWVEARVAREAIVDTPLDVLVSAERLAEIWLWRPTT